MQVKRVAINVSPGELVDKITILEIKQARFTDPERLRNVRKHLAMLKAVRDRVLPRDTILEALTRELKAVNEHLWQAEIDVRLCEQEQAFGEHFIALARSVYQHNDRRAALKRQINDHLGSVLIEEKSYEPRVGGEARRET